MPSPMYRARSLRRIQRVLPSGKTTVRYEKKKPSRARCAICGRELHGVPALRPSRLSKLAKTEKRPERPYGGYICSKCLAKELKEAIRAMIH